MRARYGRTVLVLALAAAAHAGAHLWVEEMPSPKVRFNHAMAYDIARGRLVMVGGAYSLERDPTWEYAGGTGWSVGPRLPLAMAIVGQHALCYDASRGRVVLFGGVQTRDRAWEYDGAAWAPGPLAPTAVAGRYESRLAYDAARARVVLFGGSDITNMNDTWEYDGTSWSPGPAAPAALEPRQAHAMTYDAIRQRVVLFGGEAGSARFDDTWLYDGVAWVPGPAPPAAMSARRSHGMAFDASRGRVVMYGGWDGTQDLGDVWEWDGAQWSAGAAPPAAMLPRLAHAMAFDQARSRVVVFGGLNDASRTPLSDMWEYDGSGWSLAPIIPPRTRHAMAYDAARQRVVMFGGRLTRAGERLDDTWELAGSTWNRGAAAPPGLTARFGHALSFDDRRGRTVLVGGDDGQLRNDVWEWDGASWAAAPAAPFTPRSGHAAAFDGVRGRTIVFGGVDGAGYPTDTWYYDGAWAAGPASGPGGRDGAAMAFDVARGRALLFGGRTTGTLGDTWEHDGSQWLRVFPAASPDARSLHAMAYVASSGRVVLFGGSSLNGYGYADTWEYTPGTWRVAQAVTGTPRNRYGHGMAQEDATGTIVLFGGDEWHSSLGTGTVADTHRHIRVDSHVVGAGAGQPNGNRVRVFDAGLPTSTDFFAYNAGQWGADADAASLDGTPGDEILTGPGPGPMFGPIVRGFRGSGTAIAKLNFFAYGTLRYGVNVGGGPVDGDAWSEIVTTPGPGAVFGPQVRGFDFDASSVAAIAKLNFYAYATLKYGATSGNGDVDGDGFHEILAGPGPGPTFAPLVRGFDYDGTAVAAIAKINFWAFTTLQYGVHAAGGDVDQDGFDELSCTPGPGGGTLFPARFLGFGYDAVAVSPLPGFDVSRYGSYGGRVAFGQTGGGPAADLVTALGPDPSGWTIVVSYAYDQGGLDYVFEFDAFPSPATYGANVGAGGFGY